MIALILLALNLPGRALQVQERLEGENAAHAATLLRRRLRCRGEASVVRRDAA
jgi:hypothetical protein